MPPSDDEAVPEPGLKRKSPFAPTLRLCPRCLKPLQRGSRLGGWLVPQDYICTSCGYSGVVFIEKDIKLGTTEEKKQ